jgi:hypothetical protein
MILRFPNRKNQIELDRSIVGQAFMVWKVAYGYAIHGNYNFDLSVEETQSRWNKAHDAERGFLHILHTLLSLTKIHGNAWIHIIEVEIERLERERKLDLASHSARDAGGDENIEELLREAHALLREAMER